jgi:prepilin-type N-terminal cleavage/methylation domain-containing protein
MKTKNKKGFALTEVLMAIAIVLIIGISGYQLYDTSRQNSIVEGLMNGMVDLKTNLDKSLPQNNPNIFGSQNFTQMIAQMNLVPDDFNTETGQYGFVTISYNHLFSVQVMQMTTQGEYLPGGNNGDASVAGQIVYMITSGNGSAYSESDTSAPPPMGSGMCTKLLKGMMQLFPNVWMGQAIQTNGVPASSTIVTDVCTTANQSADFTVNSLEGSDLPIINN